MDKKTSKILSVVTAATGDAVGIGEKELEHALSKHFRIPKIKLLEVVEQVLVDPTVVYAEEVTVNNSLSVRAYHLFYRLEDGGYLVVIVKRLSSGNFFSSIYPTGKSIRSVHKHLKKVKI